MRSLSLIATLLLSALGAAAADMGSPVPCEVAANPPAAAPVVAPAPVAAGGWQWERYQVQTPGGLAWGPWQRVPTQQVYPQQVYTQPVYTQPIRLPVYQPAPVTMPANCPPGG